jgi:hypothetical protein
VLPDFVLGYVRAWKILRVFFEKKNPRFFFGLRLRAKFAEEKRELMQQKASAEERVDSLEREKAIYVKRYSETQTMIRN